MKKKDILNEAKNLERKYFDLVWYVRSHFKKELVEVSRNHLRRIEKAYPDEVENLNNGKNPDWDHGFNSGMLAGMRYILSMAANGKEDADENFPFLAT